MAIDKRKLERCVRQLKGKPGVGDPFAVCTAALQKSSEGASDSEITTLAIKLSSHKKKKKRPVGYMELEELKGVEILRTGKIRGKKVDEAFLDEIVENTKKLMAQDLHIPPGKLGHDEDQLFARVSGLPATGWVESLRRVGNRLVANFSDMPKIVKEAFEKKLFRKVSSEVWFELPHPTTGKDIGPALRAVAFLGADIPEVKGLRAFLNEDLKPLTLAEGDYVSMDGVDVNTDILNGGKEPPGMTGFVPGAEPTIVGDELTEESLEGEDLVMFQEAKQIVERMKKGDMKITGFGDASTVDSLMRWAGSVGFDECLSALDTRPMAVNPERLCSWLQERANERGLLLASEKKKEETQVLKTEEMVKLEERATKAETDLATATKEGKEGVEKLAEMTKERDSLQGQHKALRLVEQNKAIAKFKEDHKETLIPALHPDFHALCEAVREDGEVVVKLSETSTEKISALDLVMRFTEAALKTKVVKLGEVLKDSKKKKGEVKKFKEIEGKGSALDAAAMELISEDKALGELFSKNKNAAYSEACNRIREANPDIEEEEAE